MDSSAPELFNYSEAKDAKFARDLEIGFLVEE
jgi:hypothetical protein